MKLKSLFLSILTCAATFCTQPADASTTPDNKTDATLLADTDIGIEYAKSLYAAYNSPEVKQQFLSAGFFDDYQVTRSGKNIYITVLFIDIIDLSTLSEQDKAEIMDQVTTSFAQGLGDYSSVYKSSGVKLIIKFTDHYGNSMTQSL